MVAIRNLEYHHGSYHEVRRTPHQACGTAEDHARCDRTARQVGFIAQNIAAVIPEAIGLEEAHSTVPDESGKGTKLRPNGKKPYFTLDDRGIQAALVNGEKSLDATDKRQQAEIDALKAELAELKELLKAKK